VKLPEDPNYHFLTDMTDQTVNWMKYQKALTPDRPFFVYYAPGATHAPHHVPSEWIAHWKGKFDQGWDILREQILARQIKQGVVPAGTVLTLAEGMTGMTEIVFINVKNKSKTITAEVEVPESGANGAIIVQGGRFGGWALYVKDGVPAYDYNFLGLNRTTIAAKNPLEPGKTTIRFEFAYDGGGLAKGGDGTLFVNGKKVVTGRIERTQPMVFSADETADVGIDLATPVVESIGSEERSRFTGTVSIVKVEDH